MPNTSYPIHFVNGKQQSAIDIQDRGLAYGDGIFETVLVVGGQIPLWSYHHARLLNGLVKLDLKLESQRLRQDVDNVLAIAKKQPDDVHILKLIVTRGLGGRGYQAVDVTPTFIVCLYPLFGLIFFILFRPTKPLRDDKSF